MPSNTRISQLFRMLLLLHVVLLSPFAKADYVLHEQREHRDQGWSAVVRAARDAVLPVRIGMAQSNLDISEDLLMEVSHPLSHKYGKYYTAEEVHNLFAPSQATVDSIVTWLDGHGNISKSRITQSVNKQWLQFDAKIEEIEHLFKTTYFEYKNGDSGGTAIGCDEYYLPHPLRQYVDYITPGILPLADRLIRPGSFAGKEFLQPGKNLKVSTSIRDCGRVITPECIRRLYNLTIGTTAYWGNGHGVYETVGDQYEQTSLNNFFHNFAPRIPNGTHPTLQSIAGGQESPKYHGDPHAEADLDFEVTYPIVYPQQVFVYQAGSDPPHYPGIYGNFLEAIDGSYCNHIASNETGLQCGIFKPTNVISFSWVEINEFILPLKYQKRQCQEFLKLGLRGVSLIFASGDDGVASGGCLSPPPGNLNKKKNSIFNHVSPVGCPYVTSVGATMLPEGKYPAADPEVAISDSGGGFSNVFPIPKYQEHDIFKYFQRYKPPFKSFNSTYNSSFAQGGGIFNRAGRGVPDVSAVGANIAIGLNNYSARAGGTSASAPIFASILTRINEERLQAGKSPIGFVNPALYANPHVMHDITRGHNSGCKQNPAFKTTKGWDPVSGLGTPNFPEMLKLFMSLQ